MVWVEAQGQHDKQLEKAGEAAGELGRDCRRLQEWALDGTPQGPE